MTSQEAERVLNEFQRWGAKQPSFPSGSIGFWARKFTQEVKAAETGKRLSK